MTRAAHDVVVIGGGPAGAACARRLARHGHDVLLAQRSTGRPRLGETCGPRARRLLDDGAAAFPEQDHLPLAAFTTDWGPDGLVRRSLTFWRGQGGLVLDRGALDRWLADAAEAAGARVLRGCQVTAGVHDERGTWRLAAVVDGQRHELRARFVVEATGRAARSVTQPDAYRCATDSLVCLSTELPDLADDEDALVEACREGWWYTVRTPTGARTVALFTDADLVARAPDRTAWFADLLRRTAHVRGTVPDPPSRLRLRGGSAGTSIRRVLWRGSWLAVGDAACFVDPLSGTGIERGLADGAAAADALSVVLHDGAFDALRAHAVGQATAFQDELKLQRRHYGAVRRWADAPFWRRRIRDVNGQVALGGPKPTSRAS